MARHLVLLVLLGLSCTAGLAASDVGKVFPPTNTKNVPQPVAFFPLTEGAGDHVTSFPNPSYLGTLNGTIPWIKDDVFGYVLECNRNDNDLIILDPVDYAGMGPFSINLWVKANASDQQGDLFQYVFSHSGSATRSNFANVDTFHPNQVHIYLPENGHPATGLVRTVVKDSTDLDTSAFMDSDGHYSDNNPRNAPNNDPVDDGAWHMITLTTHADGSTGYLIYLDGNLAASLPSTDPKALNATLDNVNLLLDGGRPIFLEKGSIYLCGRADGEPTRSFSGAVSHLSVYSTVLSATQIRALYRSVVLGTFAAWSAAAAPIGAPGSAPSMGVDLSLPSVGFANAPAALTAGPLAAAAAPQFMNSISVAPAQMAAQQLTIAGRPCQFPFFYRGEERTQCVPYSSSDSSAFCLDVDGRFSMCSPTLTSNDASFVSWMDQWAGLGQLQTQMGSNGNKDVVLCNVNATGAGPQKNCGPGFVCAPLSRAELTASTQFNAQNGGNSQSSLPGSGVGTCADPNGVTLPVGPTMPVPTAYFPLTNGSSFSWPIPQYWAYNASAIKAKQTKFVPDDLFGTVINCNASQGSSLAVEGVKWGSTGPFAFNVWINQATNPGDKFQYIISTRARALGNVTDDNIFYPNQVHVYLPSKLHPAHDTVRVIVKDSTNTFNGDDTRVFLDSDGVIASNVDRQSIRTPVLGSWHMITVSTMQNGSPGFRVYVDGVFKAALTAPQDFFQVDGGKPIYADGPIVLCDRADHMPGRTFDGKIAQLTIFDAALTENNIALLYMAVTGNMPDYSKTPAALRAAAQAVTGMSYPPDGAPSTAATTAGSSLPYQPSTTATNTQATESLSSSQAVPSVGGSSSSGSGARPQLVPAVASSASQSGSGPPVANPAIAAAPRLGVTGTATDKNNVALAGAAGRGGIKLSAGVLAGIVVAVVVGLVAIIGLAFFIARKRRQGGRWQKERLDDEGAAGTAAAAAAPQHTTFPDSQDLPKRPSPDKSKLFSGAPSHSFAVEANSSL